MRREKFINIVKAMMLFLLGSLLVFCSREKEPLVTDVSSVSLNKTSLQLKEGDSETLVATVSPSNATYSTVSWTSSDQSIASVSNGMVKAIANGTATITAKAGNKTATCTVTVKSAHVDVASITLNQTNASLKAGETVTLTATVNPSDATDKTVTWSTSDTSVATVNNGVITAVKVGTATITAKAGDQTATCTVSVKEPQSTVESTETLEEKKGEW